MDATGNSNINVAQAQKDKMLRVLSQIYILDLNFYISMFELKLVSLEARNQEKRQGMWGWTRMVKTRTKK